MTRERWIEVARIGVTGLSALTFWQGLVPIQVHWVAIAIGLPQPHPPSPPPAS